MKMLVYEYHDPPAINTGSKHAYANSSRMRDASDIFHRHVCLSSTKEGAGGFQFQRLQRWVFTDTGDGFWLLYFPTDFGLRLTADVTPQLHARLLSFLPQQVVDGIALRHRHIRDPFIGTLRRLAARWFIIGRFQFECLFNAGYAPEWVLNTKGVRSSTTVTCTSETQRAESQPRDHHRRIDAAPELTVDDEHHQQRL